METGGKSPADSQTETTLMMLPSDANPMGNVFGGTILKHVDLVAGVVAKRHARNTNCVTASIDRMTFLKPVYIGNALILSGRLNYVRRSSMEVEVKIESENLDTGSRVRTGTAFVSIVALDRDGKPTGVPPLLVETQDEKRRFAQGEQRMLARLKEASKI
ncbi:MAG TPA: acyl-CoA thioesterase [Nitrososphaera sp.]|nr:acyl-CoA thioesterase [Nitrososphaera sp.]